MFLCFDVFNWDGVIPCRAGGVGVEFGEEFGGYGVAVGVGEGLGEMGKRLIV